MTPSLTAPPTPQRFFSRPASSRRPASSSGTSETVVTPLPRRPAVSRRTLTRPPAARRCFRPGSRALRRSPSVVDQTTFVSGRRPIASPLELPQRALRRRLVIAPALDLRAVPDAAVGDVVEADLDD